MKPKKTMPAAVETFFKSVNQSQIEAFISAFDNNALISDAGREINGIDAIRSWSNIDVFGPNVNYKVVDMEDFNGNVLVIAKVDGDFDKSNLPDPLLLKHLFLLDNDKIKELIITLP